MSFSTGQPSALAIFSIACSFTETGWNSLPPPLLSIKALAALSELQTTTGSGETPGIWTQIGTPSDLYTIANMASLLLRMKLPGRPGRCARASYFNPCSAEHPVTKSTMARARGADANAKQGARRRRLAACLLRARVRDGGGRRRHTAYPLGPVHRRMAADRRRSPSARRGRMAGNLREVQADPRVPARQSRNEPRGFQGNFLVGIRPPAPRQADRRRIPAAAPVVRAARRNRPRAGVEICRDIRAGRVAGWAGLVHGAVWTGR